ncbi:hypothetical protein, partial [Luteococcus sp.]|uniref:hypothetical protein n=1 Tax=Luteococcus sp. TaxID=1969402 RepID=UPI003736380D
MSRWARACDDALSAGDHERAQRCEALMDKALSQLGYDTSTPTRTFPTKADTFTAENTAAWGDAEFEQALSSSWDDPAAVDQLMHLMDERDAQRRLDEQEQQAHQQAMQAWSQSWAEP